MLLVRNGWYHFPSSSFFSCFPVAEVLLVIISSVKDLCEKPATETPIPPEEIDGVSFHAVHISIRVAFNVIFAVNSIFKFVLNWLCWPVGTSTSTSTSTKAFFEETAKRLESNGTRTEEAEYKPLPGCPSNDPQEENKGSVEPEIPVAMAVSYASTDSLLFMWCTGWYSWCTARSRWRLYFGPSFLGVGHPSSGIMLEEAKHNHSHMQAADTISPMSLKGQ
ncbi:hypothetical protein NE237_030124 [Protea cynaroides]|uniref:Uncharacterized protein n=1 Tax=Protea cynaroides TaxID=273540 RepID=A0A9Q0GWK9_9MAGN|nr:hypothetical protein NE237_030124 [Protea cynaroides]